jgi:hypothetical protein
VPRFFLVPEMHRLAILSFNPNKHLKLHLYWPMPLQIHCVKCGAILRYSPLKPDIPDFVALAHLVTYTVKKGYFHVPSRDVSYQTLYI